MIDKYELAISRMRNGSMTKMVAECFYKHRLKGLTTREMALELGLKISQVTSSRVALTRVYGFDIRRGAFKCFRLFDVTLVQSEEYVETKNKHNEKRYHQRRIDGKVPYICGRGLQWKC